MSNNNTDTARNELNKYAQQIENLAKQVQTQLTQGASVLMTANELVRNSSTFIFVLGELSALQASGKQVQATVVSNPSGTKPNWWRERDPSTGRFLKGV
jgi:hypothetical protein